MRRLPTILNDMLLLAGVALLCAGFWMVYPPLAVILAGLAMCSAGVLGGWTEASHRRHE